MGRPKKKSKKQIESKYFDGGYGDSIAVNETPAIAVDEVEAAVALIGNPKLNAIISGVISAVFYEVPHQVILNSECDRYVNVCKTLISRLEKEL